ncbi:MAG: hypothetical protein WCD81_05325 [Candidatus Bathyarchaeia archaeon]
MGKRYSKDYSDEELRKQAGDLENAVTIPVNVEIKQITGCSTSAKWKVT